MERGTIRHAIVLAGLALPLWGQLNSGCAEDQIELLLRSDRVPANMGRKYAYSDFSDPLGRFLDFLAAGAFSEARALQPNACMTWLATRQDSALTGKFWVWNTQIDLNTLCTPR